LPTSETLFQRSWGLSRCAGPRLSCCFWRPFSVGRQGPMADRWSWSRPVYPCRIYRHGVQPAVPRLEPRPTALCLRHISVASNRRLRVVRWRLHSPKGGGPRAYCRGADGTRRAALQVREFSGFRSSWPRPWGCSSTHALDALVMSRGSNCCCRPCISANSRSRSIPRHLVWKPGARI